MQLVGRPERTNLDLRVLRDIGVRLVGRTAGIDDGVLQLNDDLAEAVAGSHGADGAPAQAHRRIRRRRRRAGRGVACPLRGRRVASDARSRGRRHQDRRLGHWFRTQLSLVARAGARCVRRDHPHRRRHAVAWSVRHRPSLPPPPRCQLHRCRERRCRRTGRGYSSAIWTQRLASRPSAEARDMFAHQAYDALVVGARCAGAATAMLMARQGMRVLVIDRGGYGTDTISTHALMRGGVLQLHRWGILPRLQEAGTPPVRETTFHYGDEAITVAIKPSNGVDALYAPRRTLLDRTLVDAARRRRRDSAAWPHARRPDPSLGWAGLRRHGARRGRQRHAGRSGSCRRRGWHRLQCCAPRGAQDPA